MSHKPVTQSAFVQWMLPHAMQRCCKLIDAHLDAQLDAQLTAACECLRFGAESVVTVGGAFELLGICLNGRDQYSPAADCMPAAVRPPASRLAKLRAIKVGIAASSGNSAVLCSHVLTHPDASPTLTHTPEQSQPMTDVFIPDTF